MFDVDRGAWYTLGGMKDMNERNETMNTSEMKALKVYHLNRNEAREHKDEAVRKAAATASLGFQDLAAEVKILKNAGLYHHVATLRVNGSTVEEALERAFYLTNHVDSDWTMGFNLDHAESLTRPEEIPARSTSVGDYMEDEATGFVYVVRDLGFQAL